MVEPQPDRDTALLLDMLLAARDARFASPRQAKAKNG
jgi:hypothetical protein